MKYLLIGGGIASVHAIEAIREQDAEGEICLLAGEKDFPYGRPLISYWLEGKVDDAHMDYRPRDFFDRNRVDYRPGVKAEKLLPEAHCVEAGGERLPYDRLLLATGAVPFLPPIPGVDTVENRCSFMNWADARRLRQLVTPQSRVMILGAGLIGMKCAEALVGQVASLSVVDLAERVLPSVLDADASARVQRHMEGKGIAFRLGDTADSFAPGEARLRSGETLPFDVLVTAVGVRPDTALAGAAGAAVTRGIVTDTCQRTSLPEVFAAGDCTCSHDLSDGKDKPLMLLPNAALQGRTAGLCMAGLERPWDKAIPMNAGGFCGLHIATAGSYTGETRTLEDGEGFRQFFVAENRLKGFILLGDVAKAGIFTALIRERTPLDSLDFPLLCSHPGLAAFELPRRQQILGGRT